MNLSNFKSMDPNILYSMVNMALRDFGENLSVFCKTHDINEEELKEVLAKADYHYIEEINQFK